MVDGSWRMGGVGMMEWINFGLRSPDFGHRSDFKLPDQIAHFEVFSLFNPDHDGGHIINQNTDS